jgi:probable F420-dependent oxidoreductase
MEDTMMARLHPFRFGVFAEGVGSRAALLDTARRAEDGGFATFLMRDHFISEPFGHQLAPLTALATVAAVTRTLRIGSLVFANDYRHPVVLAKEVATLDVLSEGRFELGLGAGFSRAEYEQAGIAFDPPHVRAERLEEALHVVKGLFSDAPFTLAGQHYSVSSLNSFPKPLQRPHPPILVGAASSRMLSIAARHADIIGLQTVSTTRGVLAQDPKVRSASTVTEKIDQVRQAADERFDEIELSMVASVIITDHRQEAAEQFARDRGWRAIAADEVLTMPSVFIGTVDYIAEEMQGRRERYGVSYYVLFDQLMESVAPLVTRLAGE